MTAQPPPSEGTIVFSVDGPIARGDEPGLCERLRLALAARGDRVGRDVRAVVAPAGAALSAGVGVALVEQPYRVAGRRSPPPAHQLDAAWTAVVDHLHARELRGLPLLVGGRSSGGRVACRTAEATRAVGVLCLAFPL